MKRQQQQPNPRCDVGIDATHRVQLPHMRRWEKESTYVN